MKALTSHLAIIVEALGDRLLRGHAHGGASMADRPKFSVLIPTRNRSESVTFAVRNVLDQSGDDFELIVSDSHSGDDTLAKLQGIKDDRLKIVQPDSVLAMSEHFEWLLQRAEVLLDHLAAVAAADHAVVDAVS